MLKYKNAFWLLLIVCSLTMFPFLGLSDYHTKGEPRESIVSYCMLETGNWVLPRNNGGEMAYKPPFFHWCVAAVSAVQGKVTEGSSRLPSALALIAMTMATFCFFRKRTTVSLALTASLVAFTSFELHRAGGNCRVDMVLTALTVCALFCLYRWHERGMRGIPLLAILLMGLGTLTKGPVGSIIPCLVMGVYMLLRRENFWKTLGWLSLFGVLSLIPYALWFVAAWHQGGQEFLDLMYEENIGRMTNTMSYDSCVEPWYYNFLTILSGWIPYTLLALLALILTGCLKNIRNLWNKSKISNAWKLRNNSPIDLFALTSIVIIFVFYCIPQSKRSVYLMPIYPFIGYFIARMMLWMGEKRTMPLNIFNGILATISILLFIVFIVLKFVDIPDTMFHGRHALQNQMTMEALGSIGQWWQVLIVIITTAIGVLWWVYRKHVSRGFMAVVASIVLVLGIYLSLDGVYNPTVLNVKSIKGECPNIDRAAPVADGKLYEYMEVGVKAKGDPAHFFEVNFYLGNRIGSFHIEKPQSGFLLISEEDFKLNEKQFASEGYCFEKRYEEPKRKMQIYHFEKK